MVVLGTYNYGGAGPHAVSSVTTSSPLYGLTNPFIYGAVFCDGACGGDETSSDIFTGDSGDINGGGGPAQPVNPNKKHGQCSSAAVNLAKGTQQAGFVMQTGGGGTMIVGGIVAGLSFLTGQPEGVAFGLDLAASGAGRVDFGSVLRFGGALEQCFALSDPSSAASAGAGEAASRAVDAAAEAAQLNPVGKMAGAIAGEQVEQNSNSNSSSCPG